MRECDWRVAGLSVIERMLPITLDAFPANSPSRRSRGASFLLPTYSLSSDAGLVRRASRLAVSMFCQAEPSKAQFTTDLCQNAAVARARH